ncbi:hypothetical protein GCM10020216_074250 [Nonomuraea helvata]
MLCLWREDGEWSRQGPDGVIDVAGLGLFGHIKARGVSGAPLGRRGRPVISLIWRYGRSVARCQTIGHSMLNANQT